MWLHVLDIYTTLLLRHARTSWAHPQERAGPLASLSRLVSHSHCPPSVVCERALILTCALAVLPAPIQPPSPTHDRRETVRVWKRGGVRGHPHLCLGPAATHLPGLLTDRSDRSIAVTAAAPSWVVAACVLWGWPWAPHTAPERRGGGTCPCPTKHCRALPSIELERARQSSRAGGRPI